MTRTRIDRVARAWAIASFVAWFVLLAIALGSTSNVARAETSDSDQAAATPAPVVEHRRDSEQTSVDAVAPTVMCPSCDKTLDESDSPAAERMRAWIAAAVAQGWTADEIRDGLVAEYDGDESILAAPRARDGIGIGAWLAPIVIILAMVLVGVVLPRRWRRSRAAANDDAR